MADNKWSKWREKHLETKTKSCQPRRKTSKVEKTFQESAEITEKPNKILLIANKISNLNRNDLRQNWRILETEKLLASTKCHLKYQEKKFNDIFLRLCNTVYTQNIIGKWRKSCILLLPKKGNHKITKNYSGIALTGIAAKVYNNTLLLNRIQPEVEKILSKKSKQLSKKLIHNVINSDYPSYHRWSTRKKKIEATLL